MKLLDIINEEYKPNSRFRLIEDETPDVPSDVIPDDELPDLQRRAIIQDLTGEGNTPRWRVIITPDTHIVNYDNVEIYEWEGATAQSRATRAIDHFNNNRMDDFAEAVRLDSGRGAPRRITEFGEEGIDAIMARARGTAQTRNGLFLQKLNRSPVLSKILPVIGLLGSVYEAWLLMGESIEMVREGEADLDPGTDREAIIGILEGMFYAQTTLLFLSALRIQRILTRFIRAIRLAMGAGSLYFAPATGGTSILAMIAGQAALYVVEWFLLRPEVQIQFAEWCSNNAMAALGFQGYASLVNMAASALNTLTGGLIGSENLSRALGFDPTPPDTNLRGDVVASSEWAKLVFADIIFPPDQEKLRVPYFTPAQCRQMLSNAFEIDSRADQPAPEENPDTPAPAPEPESVNSGGPGFRPGQ